MEWVTLVGNIFNTLKLHCDNTLTHPPLRAHSRVCVCSGSFARPYGNGCAMLGLFFSSMESLLISQLDQVGIPDTVCTIAAGGCLPDQTGMCVLLLVQTVSTP